MTAVIIDGRVRVTFAVSVASVAAPTVAEANAGTALEGFIRPDGLDIGMDTGGVDTSNLKSTFTTMRAGRKKPSINIGFHHDGPVDTPYTLLPYRTTGFLLVRRGVDATTAWTVADKLEVYPVETGEAVQVKPTPDNTWDFDSPMFVMSDPNTRAVMA